MPLTRRLLAGTALATSACWVAISLAAVPQSTTKSKQSAPGKSRPGVTASKRATAATASKSTGTKRATAKRRSASRRLRYRQRMARLRLEPERIKEIQQALVQVGYLNQEPDGNWDDATRDAMRRYQADHGFPTTGMPEAKSLLKLGLGPHPLPPEADPSAPVQSLTEGPTATGSTAGEANQAISTPGSPPPQK